jgi:hypothetical protein
MWCGSSSASNANRWFWFRFQCMLWAATSNRASGLGAAGPRKGHER